MPSNYTEDGKILEQFVLASSLSWHISNQPTTCISRGTQQEKSQIEGASKSASPQQLPVDVAALFSSPESITNARLQFGPLRGTNITSTALSLFEFVPLQNKGHKPATHIQQPGWPITETTLLAEVIN